MRHSLLSLGGLVTLFLVAGSVRADEPAQAIEPTHRPALRIETGMHIAPIRSIGIDAAERYLATGSSDKTVRIWDLRRGLLLQTLRPPIAEGPEGWIYAVAMSPDGRTIACGGFTDYTWEKQIGIYLFDRVSGRIVRRITGLPNVINSLAYSPDGRYLAVTLGGKGGLRVYRTTDYTQVAADNQDYEGGSYSVDFAADNRIVTTTLNGSVWLYSPDFRPTAHRKLPGGHQVYSARFSPDGKQIAVGLFDIPQVAVLSGTDLDNRFVAQAGKENRGGFHNVCWSQDGRYLYAAGIYNANRAMVVVRWGEEGHGKPSEFNTGHPFPILDLRPLQHGELAFCTIGPLWARLTSHGGMAVRQDSPTPDYHGQADSLLVSGDGGTVQFRYAAGEDRSTRFSVSPPSLKTGVRDAAVAAGELRPTVTGAPGLTITDWENRTNPAVNGVPLRLEPGEMSRSVAIAPNRQSFVLGAEFFVRCFDSAGKMRWRTPAPGPAYAVNLSDDGKICVAACGDGTVRWLNMADGHELLALFPHADHRRWIVWTPAGYYACSQGGENLIGWHLNNGKDMAADFFPASRFRDDFYRPDLVTRALQGAGGGVSDVPPPPPDVTRIAPPSVRIVSPEAEPGSEIEASEKHPTLTLRYAVRPRSNEPVTAVHLLIDGRPVSTTRALKPLKETVAGETTAAPGETVAEEVVQVPGHDCEISVIAENRFATSEASTIHVHWAGNVARLPKPKLFLLAIGVATYPGESALVYPAKDAQDVADALTRQKGRFYREVEVKLLTDGQATRSNILDGFSWIEQQPTEQDVAIIFVSGHGFNDDQNRYYFLPVDMNARNIRESGVGFSEFVQTLREIKSKAVLFADTCYAGNVVGHHTMDLTRVSNTLTSDENGVVVFTSSTGNEESLENPNWHNGAFTRILVDGLSGEADVMKTGQITIAGLNLYLSTKVNALTGGAQHPTMGKPSTIPDFAIAAAR